MSASETIIMIVTISIFLLRIILIFLNTFYLMPYRRAITLAKVIDFSFLKKRQCQSYIA